MMNFPSREPRYAVNLDAAVRRTEGVVTSSHRVRNLSSGGACISNGADFEVGETISANLGLLIAVSATVRWIDGGVAGLSFASPIDIDAAQARYAPRRKRKDPARLKPATP